MKNFLLTLIVITSLVACNSDQKENKLARDIQLLSDSTVYTNSNIYTDKMNAVDPDEVEEEVASSRVIKKTKSVAKAPRVNTKAPVYTSNDNYEVAPPVPTPPVINVPETNTGNSETVGAGEQAGTETAGTSSQTEKKKGWNKATQGAVIGGVTGAVGGAIISKKKGLGAIIGGVAGAAGGYIIGKMDKKDNQFVMQ